MEQYDYVYIVERVYDDGYAECNVEKKVVTLDKEYAEDVFKMFDYGKSDDYCARITKLKLENRPKKTEKEPSYQELYKEMEKYKKLYNSEMARQHAISDGDIFAARR